MDKAEIERIIDERLAFMIKNKKLVFPYPMQILDGNDITIGQGTGTRIGTSQTQKLGFYGATPIVPFTNYFVNPTGGATVDSNARGAINDIHNAFLLLGIATNVV